MMNKKNLLILAAAALSFAACSDEIAETPPVVNNTPQETQEAPIVFGSLSKGTTRADITGADAAALLGKQFVVSGYKGPKTEWDGTDSKIVFDNYAVRYKENTAYTTESNTRNWEYVGEERIKHAIDHGITRQAAKYWDFTIPQYDFIAWSTGTKTAIYEGTVSAGEVLVSAITPATAFGTSGVAYTLTGASADLTNCYVADLVTVKKADYGDNPVTLKFRSLGSKVRIGLYETIPGYSVRDVKFYSAAATNDAEATKPRLFTTAANMVYTNGTYTVFYPTVDKEDDADNNQAHIRFTPVGDQSTLVNFTGMNYTIAEDGEKTPGKVFLGRSSATATMAGEAEGNYYTQYLPNEAGVNLNLRVDYTLESIDGSGETITVRGATAQVPSIYTQWKSGFAYTYIFKISDKTNGHTGEYDPLHPDDTTINSDPVGLYPITFDAMIVDDEEDDNTQETITTVTHPSITTYQEGSNVVNNDEYTVGKNIYVVVSDGKSDDTPDLANGSVQKLTGKAALYTIPVGKTEAEVIDALQLQDDDAEDNTVKGRSGLVLSNATLKLTGRVNYGVDGNAIIVGGDKVAVFTPEAGKTYAFVYTKKAAVPENDKVFYQPVAFNNTTVATKYRYGYKAATAGDAQKGVNYYNLDGGVYSLVTPFIGQDVSNVYLDNTGATIASGYAKTGTTYYYTDNHGMSYKAATNIAYDTFAGDANIGTYDGTTFTAKTETTPADGKAYYKRTGAGTEGDPYVYTYCIILPQQADGWYVIDTEKYEKATETTAVDGMTYFDKFTQNDGVYYTKVIKVQ